VAASSRPGPRVVSIDGRAIDATSPFVIAEAGVNHNGAVALALRLADEARRAGADAVKFQAFDAAEIADADAPKAEYQRRQTEAAESQQAMLARLQLSEEALGAIADHCRTIGIMFLASAFDRGSVDALDRLGVAAHKIASGEITNVSLLRHVARSRRPIILSTGMSDLDDVRAALAVLREAGDPAVILLQCTSQYPADPRDVNLRAMRTLADEFQVPVGFSDHTEGIDIAIAAAALGAAVIEKHFTLDRSMEGPDHAASIEPGELAALVGGVRRVADARGDGLKRPAPSELATRDVVRRRLVARLDLAAGSILTEESVAARRPGNGISPVELPRVIGRRVRQAITAGAPIQWTNLE